MLTTNENFITIKNDLMKFLIDTKKIGVITSRISRGSTNVYYSIGDAVLMRLSDETYVLIDRYINSDVGIKVDVVSELVKYTWSMLMSETNKRTNRNYPTSGKIREDLPNRSYLPRVLMHLKIYGTLNHGRLQSDYHVHHEGYVFDNRIEHMAYIPKELHTDRHSHIRGYRLETLDDFHSFKDDMNL